MNRVNWEVLVPVLKKELVGFVSGTVSGRQLYQAALNKNVGPEVRFLIRSGGVDRARDLARKALGRRA